MEQRLRASDKWIRKSAVEALAKCADEPALVRLVSMLGDEAGEVADTAEWCLVRTLNAAVVEQLQGDEGVRARDAWVRRRAWGVLRTAPLEHLTGLKAQSWRRGLGDDDEGARVAALGAAERVVGAESEFGAMGAVQRGVASARRSKDARVAAAALFVQAEGGWKEARSSWADAAEDRRPVVRSAAVRTAISLGELPESLTRFLEHDAGAVVLATESLSLEAAGPLLVRCLEEGRPLGLRTRAWRELAERSGWRHGLESRAWQAWAGDPILCPGRREVKTQDVSTSVATYAPPSDRVVLLVDLSGSVWRERADGSAPRDDLVASTSAIVNRLPESARFDLGVFTAEVEFVAGELVAAKRSRKRAAGKFLDDASMRGPGDIWRAMERALEDPDVDTLVLLTDGAPTGGRRHRLEVLAEVWGERTRTRPVALEVLLIDAPPRVHRGWQRLVDAGGGRVLDAVLGDE